MSWTEATANGFAETELPKKFDTDEYQILVVAEKYQTGFDQPKLVAMYVDREARRAAGGADACPVEPDLCRQDRTFVLDFQNTMEDIKSAFSPFFEATALKEATDLNQIYDLEQRVKASGYIHKDEVERFAERFFQGTLTHRTGWPWRAP
jgi:type I restriction enzyme R subunit